MIVSTIFLNFILFPLFSQKEIAIIVGGFAIVRKFKTRNFFFELKHLRKETSLDSLAPMQIGDLSRKCSNASKNHLPQPIDFFHVVCILNLDQFDIYVMENPIRLVPLAHNQK